MPATEFYDRNNKQIFSGDIVQYKLGNLSDGGTRAIVVKVKHGYKICWLKGDEYYVEDGWLLRKSYKPYLTVIDTSNREY